VLREVLARASYDERTVRELVCVDGLDAVHGLAALSLRPTADQPLARLVRLFLAGDGLDTDAAEAALAPATIDDLETAGVVERTPEGKVRARVRLDPVRGLIVASDHRRPGESSARDHVIYPGPASDTLASLTVRAPVGRALDLCCGSGIQALAAARHAERVVGTDLNPRALRLAVLSAGLSGLDNVEWRAGDLFAPIGQERFELVVSNPPFVISPEKDLTYRDGGRSGDELSREVVVGCAARLEQGGYGHVLCSWVRAPGEHYAEAPRRWLSESGCDVFVLHLDTETPASYALRWNSAEAATVTQAVNTAGRWQGYYAELGIEAIATGVVTTRRRAGSNWLFADELVATGSDAGDHVERVFAGHDALERIGDDRELLEARLSLAAGVTLTERRRAGGEIVRARVSDADGVRLPGAVTPSAAGAALVALDGRRTLAEAAMAAHVPTSAVEAALPSIRDLIKRGYVILGTGNADGDGC
jgi:methylase of polypeptide subunit release factors